MGVTIHYKLGQKKNTVKTTLDRAEKLAGEYKKQADIIGTRFETERLTESKLYIDIGKCETLAFDFRTVPEWKAEQKAEALKRGESVGWSYQLAILTDDGKQELDEGYEIEKYPQNEKAYCVGFCKTQFARSLAEHRWVAELVRSVAGYCFMAEVSDEGDYYNTGDIRDVENAIVENGKLISSISRQFSSMGWDQIQTNITRIRGRKK